MPSLASLSQEERSHLRKSCASAGSRSWQPLEMDISETNDNNCPRQPAPSRTSSGEQLPVPTLLPLTSTAHHAAAAVATRRTVEPNTDASDDDTVSLLSDPGEVVVVPPPRFPRRGRRRRGADYRPLRMSLSQVTDESKACFPVYGCASFLLSLLVAAIFVFPPPSSRQTAGVDFALLPCRRRVWEEFGYHDVVAREDEEDHNNCTTTTTTDWWWFLQQVDETSDRCRDNTKDGDAAASGLCTCQNPTQPRQPRADGKEAMDEETREYAQLWESTFMAHQARIKNETVLPPFTDVELVLVGDSLTEHFLGTSLGRPKPAYEGVGRVFQNALRDNHEERPYIHTTPFGISGDRCSQALYRIQNGAVIPTEPRLGIATVFWVWIGTNDIISDFCGPEQVVAGVLAIVRELKQRRPDAWVVVQSLLPSQRAEPAVVDSINQAMKCLTDSTRKAFYYNSSNVFMKPKTNAINASRFMSDQVHPNAEGAMAWAKSMLHFLRRLYDARYYH